AFDTDQPATHIGEHLGRVALERIAPATATPGVEQQHVAGGDLDVVALGGQHLAATIGPHQLLAAARARLAATDAPGVGEPAIVVNRYLAVDQHAVADPQAVAAPMQAGTAGVRQGFVALDT